MPSCVAARIPLDIATKSPMMAPMDDHNLITVYRVLVSGQAQVFDEIGAAIGYLRSQVKHNLINEVVIQTDRIEIGQYAAEIEKGDGA